MTVQSIKEQFDKVIKYSQCVPDPKTDKLFETWEKSKEYFYKLFGNKYIYELPDEVVFDLSKKAKQQRIDNFLDALRYYYGQEALSDFIEDQEEGFFDNLTIKDYNYEGKIITKGSKLVRAFKYFIANEGLLTDLQNQASRIIQESKINGKLCLSIHPLDYLSISENNYNWRSCHSLDGEYRAGNISYLLDSTTVVCYLKGADEVKLPNFPEDVPWNDKKWRVLLYFSNDKNMIFAGRQYPFDSEAGMDIVRYDLLEDAIKFASPKKSKWTQWNKIIYPKVKITDDVKVVLDQGFVPIGYTVKPLGDVVFNVEGSRQFNDVLSSSCYKPHYIAKCSYNGFWDNDYYLATNNDTRFDIGAYTPCICCGEEAAMYDADTMMCYDCDAIYGKGDNDIFTYCDCCGCRVARDDLYFVGDDYLCPNCFDNETTRCEHCGERVYNSDIKYIEKLDKYICCWCEELMEREEKLTEKQEGRSFYTSSASSDLANFKIIFDENEGIDFLNQYVSSIDLNQANQAVREINYVKPTEEDYDELPF